MADYTSSLVINLQEMSFGNHTFWGLFHKTSCLTQDWDRSKTQPIFVKCLQCLPSVGEVIQLTVGFNPQKFVKVPGKTEKSCLKPATREKDSLQMFQMLHVWLGKYKSHLKQALDHSRWLIVDATLEASGAPIHELDGSLGLDGCNGRVHVLWHHISFDIPTAAWIWIQANWGVWIRKKKVQFPSFLVGISRMLKTSKNHEARVYGPQKMWFSSIWPSNSLGESFQDISKCPTLRNCPFRKCETFFSNHWLWGYLNFDLFCTNLGVLVKTWWTTAFCRVPSNTVWSTDTFWPSVWVSPKNRLAG